MRYVVVKVTRSEAAERVSEFRPWEVPILQLIHGQELVQIVGEVDYPKIPYPEASAEYERLETRYKSPEGTDVSYCRSIYGIGPMNLAKAIEDAEQEASERDAIPFQPAQANDAANRGYLAAERAALEKDKQAVAAERAQLAKERQEKVEAERNELEAREAALAAREKALADGQAQLVKDQAAVAELLDAATADPAKPAPAAAPAKPAGKAKVETPAKPITE